MRLSLDLIEHSPVFTNTVGDRELDLRGRVLFFIIGNKIVAIENLSSTRDLLDTIDLSDNEINRLENIPPLYRLKNLYLSNNRITKIDPSIAQKIPFLQALILSGNSISELTDLVPFAGWSNIGKVDKKGPIIYKASLETLSLIDNPVTKKPNYRLFLISIAPSLKVLDYSKVTEKVVIVFKLFLGAETSFPTSFEWIIYDNIDSIL